MRTSVKREVKRKGKRDVFTEWIEGMAALAESREGKRSSMSSSRRRSPSATAQPSALANIEFLIDGNGDITIGRVASIPCVATAADEDQCLAMLVRRPGAPRAAGARDAVELFGRLWARQRIGRVAGRTQV